MTDYARRAVMLLLLILVVILSISRVKERESIIKIIRVPDPNFIPSARQIQQRLTDLGKARYDPNGVDGWIGKDSRTAWDNYTCDRYAKREFEGEPK